MLPRLNADEVKSRHRGKELAVVESPHQFSVEVLVHLEVRIRGSIIH